ncbi:hypothetical protein BR63_19170 [Thermanaerosceptrum fracticalcis]|uniref:Uncharacterized protein n=1 Tax=Thermanaerosceptrum fracticalcis TaxID=1712410 RepID=A0A7G6E7Z9_THEFR|nr:hypothetical protein [Thermanaerosceptrum fracticalcis]QNB48203.1 hypothetical protein BR63_19170 [Thermanaerosceptrum fracticalcis]
MKPMYKRAKVDIALPAQSIVSANVTGAYFGMQMYNKALAVLNVGAMADTNTAKIELLQAKDASGTDAKAITGAEATITASGSKTSGCAFVEVDVSSLDLANGFEYIAAKVTTTGTIVSSVVLLRGDGRFEPEQDADAFAAV